MTNRSVALVLASSTGGVGQHVRSLAQGLVGAGWSVRVCGPPATDELFGFHAVGADFRPVAIGRRWQDLAGSLPMRRAVAGSAIVHAHGLRAGVVSVVSTVGTHLPVVVTWHNRQLEAGGRPRSLGMLAQRFVARRAVVNLVASEDLGTLVRQLGGRDVRLAPVAVSPGIATRSVAQTRAELGLRQGQSLVLSVSRLHPQKGLDVLVRAAARWSPAEVAVVVAGDGPLQHELEVAIAAAAAPVQLLGRRSDIADLLAAADLVVLTSRWEARSLAAQEALLAGRPLIATNVGGLPGLLGEAAVLVPPDDVDALDGAVLGLLKAPDRRADLARRGLVRAAGWPTEADTTAQVAATYAEILGDDAT